MSIEEIQKERISVLELIIKAKDEQIRLLKRVIELQK